MTKVIIFRKCAKAQFGDTTMKPTNTVAKLFSSVSTLAVVAGAMAFNSVAWGQETSVLAWGYNGSGNCTIPASASSGVSAIAVGWSHTIALKNGAVLAWGKGTQDITGGGSFGGEFGQCIIPTAALSGVSAIAGGGYHTIALKNSAVLVWGNNDSGQRNIPASANSGVSAIAGGGYHTAALKGGAVLAWGSNSHYQCTIPASASSGVSAIACGDYHTIALKNGEVLAWGAGRSNRGCCDEFGQSIVPTAALSGVSAVAGGYKCTYVIKNGALLAWGLNDLGQCTIPASASSGVIAIGCGRYHTTALKYLDPDTDGDGIPNATDNCPNVSNPTQADCDGNGVGDACELDCNGNGLADVCEFVNGTVSDCNSNGIPDSCDIANGVAQDCNNNGVPDFCEIISGAVGDFNENNIPDSCDVVSGLLNDFNHNGIADSVELVTVTAQLAAVTNQLECGDLNNDGHTDSTDLGLLLLRYGTCQSEALIQQPQEPMIFPMAEAAKPVAVKK